MRHRKTGIKLNRTSSHRQAMFRNMVTSLFKHDRIRTTDVKAKELRRWADKMITLAKRGDLHARRQALAVIREKEVVYRLFNEAQERYGSISGGYTRVVKLGRRPGDAAPISLVELVSGKVTPKPSKKTVPATPVEKAEETAETIDTQEVEAATPADEAPGSEETLTAEPEGTEPEKTEIAPEVEAAEAVLPASEPETEPEAPAQSQPEESSKEDKPAT